MRGELKEYVMPDGCTYQYWDCDVPPEAKPVEKQEKAEGKKTTRAKKETAE